MRGLPGSDFCQTSRLKAEICLLRPRGTPTSVDKVKPASFLFSQTGYLRSSSFVLFFFFSPSLMLKLIFLQHYLVTTASISQTLDKRFPG